MVKRVPVSEIFIGRDKIIQQLEDEFHDFLETSCGRIMFVAGEAGIGKTTLVNHFLSTLSSAKELEQFDSKPQFFTLQAKCSDITTSGNPYAPFGDLFDGFQFVETIGFKETLGDWAKDLGPKLLEGIVPYLGPFLAGILEKQFAKGTQKEQTNGNIAAGQTYQFLKLLDQASKISPLILFIDDLHWADEPSINLIFALARRISEMPVLLIGTYRPHDIAEKPDHSPHPLSKVLFQMQRYNLYKEIMLDAFSLEEVQSFLVERFPNNNFPSSLAFTLHNETNGIPFFLDQVLQLLVDSGTIFLDSNDQWTILSLETVPIPRGVLAVLQARIKNLDPDFRLMLSYASVLGEQFRSRVLSEILNEPHLHILRSLRTLENAYNLVRQKVEPLQPNLQPNWEFNHAFVHQALYDSLADEERTEIHSLAVDILEIHFPKARNELASELAYHCEAAWRYEDAIEYRLSAAQRVHRARGFSEQVFHCTKGISAIRRLALPRQKIKEEVIFYSGLADAYRRFMNLQKVENVAHKLLDLAKRNDNSMAKIEGNLRMLQVAVLRDNKDETRLFSTQAWMVAQQSRIPDYLIPVIGFFQHENFVRGVHQFAPAQLKQLLDNAINACQREKLLSVLSRALMTRAIVAFLEDEFDQAQSIFTQAIKTVELANSNERHVFNDFPFYALYFDTNTLLDDCFEHIGRIHQKRGEWEKAIREFERVYRRKEAEKNLPGMAGLLNVIAETQLQAGFHKEAQQSFERSWVIAEQTDSSELKAMVLSTGISIAIAEEDISSLQARLQLFKEISREWNVGWIWEKRRLAEDILNDYENTVNLNENILLAGLKQAKKDSDLYLITHFNSRLANWYLKSDDLDKALYYANDVLQTVFPKELEIDWIEHIGRIHQKRGEWEKAIREFERVYRRKEAEKNLPGMAGLLNVIAETQLQAGFHKEAQQSFERSWVIAEQTDSSELKAMVLSTGISIAIAVKNYREIEIRLKMFEKITGDKNDIDWIKQKKRMTWEFLNKRTDFNK